MKRNCWKTKFGKNNLKKIILKKLFRKNYATFRVVRTLVTGRRTTHRTLRCSVLRPTPPPPLPPESTLWTRQAASWAQPTWPACYTRQTWRPASSVPPSTYKTWSEATTPPPPPGRGGEGRGRPAERRRPDQPATRDRPGDRLPLYHHQPTGPGVRRPPHPHPRGGEGAASWAQPTWPACYTRQTWRPASSVPPSTYRTWSEATTPAPRGDSPPLQGENPAPTVGTWGVGHLEVALCDDIVTWLHVVVLRNGFMWWTHGGFTDCHGFTRYCPPMETWDVAMASFLYTVTYSCNGFM